MSVPIAYATVILIWSTTPLAIKWSGEGPGFLFGVTGRMAIATLLCLLLVRVLGIAFPWHAKARQVYLAGALAVYGAMSCVYWGAQFIPSGLVSVVFGLTPVMTAVFAGFLLAEKALSVHRLTGTLLGIAGLAVIFQSSLAMGGGAVNGVLGVLFAVILHSLSTVWIKRIGVDIPALAQTAGSLLLAMPMYLVTFLLSGESLPTSVDLRAGLSITYLGVVGSVLGYTLFFYMLKHLQASHVALVPLVTPVLALLIGVLVNNEHVGQEVIAGTVLILAGLWLHQFGSLVRQRG
jgi:drug/metabolite transporter (DMT)-like permease